MILEFKQWSGAKMSIHVTEMTSLQIEVDTDPDAALAKISELLEQTPDKTSRCTLLLFRAAALTNKGEITAAKQLSQEVTNIALLDQDNYLLSKCYWILSVCNRDDPVAEKRFVDLSLEAALQTKDNDLIGEAHDGMGDYFFNQGDFHTALRKYKQALTLVAKGDNPRLTEMILQSISGAYYMLRKHRKAREFIIAALEINKKTRSTEDRIAELINLAILNQKLMRFEEMEADIAEAISTAEKADNPSLLAAALSNAASFMLDLGNYEKGIEISYKCLDVLPLDDYPENLQTRMVLKINIANAYLQIGDMRRAKEYLSPLTKAAENNNDFEFLIQCKLLWMDIHWAAGELIEAEQAAKEAQKLCRKHKIYEKMIIIQESIAARYEKANKHRQCIATYKSMVKTLRRQLKTLQDTPQDKGISISVHDHGLAQKTGKALSQGINVSSECVMYEFVGHSPAAETIRNKINVAAHNPTANVLIIGETGTGKEIVANLIHNLSPRCSHPMISVNTAAIPSSLMESELFGHKKGAFTNAYQDSQGLFLRADQGTLFLDEISEMPFDLQVKLLRVLESRKVTPLGGTKEIAFRCRIISSTNRDLHSLVHKHAFRLDLMHRLNTFVIDIPPLRQRPEDIPLLIKYYRDKFAADMSISPPVIKSSFLNTLTSYHFPGNVRELVNIVHRMMILYQESVWKSEQLVELGIVTIQKKPCLVLKENHQHAERDEIIEALQKVGGKQKAAAILLGYSESTLCRRIAKYALEEYTPRGK
jgi:two-component system, NtrC family, response regulator AtoC